MTKDEKNKKRAEDLARRLWDDLSNVIPDEKSRALILVQTKPAEILASLSLAYENNFVDNLISGNADAEVWDRIFDGLDPLFEICRPYLKQDYLETLDEMLERQKKYQDFNNNFFKMINKK
jgi:hypothetical protein